MFTFPEAAVRQIQQAANDSAAQHLAIRVAAKIDVDGSTQYGMGFDDLEDMDLKLDLPGIAVAIGSGHQELLINTTLDFVELQPGQVSFIFTDQHQHQHQHISDFTSGHHCDGGGCGSCSSQSGSRQ